MNKITTYFFFKVILPYSTSAIRVFLYRYYFKYQIGSNVKLGKAVLKANKVVIGDNVVIKDSVFFANEIQIGSNSIIHSGNIASGSSSFKVGCYSRIINNHFFDLTKNISIGNRTWIAGRGSQFWTHGSTKTQSGKDLSISIMDDCYIGTSVIVNPGVIVESNNLIASGSVLFGEFKQGHTLVLGNPAKVVKESFDWHNGW